MRLSDINLKEDYDDLEDDDQFDDDSYNQDVQETARIMTDNYETICDVNLMTWGSYDILWNSWSEIAASVSENLYEEIEGFDNLVKRLEPIKDYIKLTALLSKNRTIEYWQNQRDANKSQYADWFQSKLDSEIENKKKIESEDYSYSLRKLFV